VQFDHGPDRHGQRRYTAADPRQPQCTHSAAPLTIAGSMMVLFAGTGSATRIPSALGVAIAGVGSAAMTSEQRVGPLVVKS
jgi:hypothetical protein